MKTEFGVKLEEEKTNRDQSEAKYRRKNSKIKNQHSRMLMTLFLAMVNTFGTVQLMEREGIEFVCRAMEIL
jgi:very-short-patch-repair endonuclease